MYPQISPEINETLKVVQEMYDSGASKILSPDAAKAFNTGLGLIPYNLEGGAKLLAPVITPYRNMVPRNKGYGKATEFKAITSYNSTQANGWVAEGTSGAELTTTTVDVLMPYKIASLKNKVTFEAQYFGRGQVDSKALAVANLLRAFMIDEEDRMLFGNPTTGITGASTGGTGGNYPSSGVTIGGALGTTPALTSGTAVGSTTGGTLAAGTYNFQITYRTGPDYGAGKTSESIPGAAFNVVTTGATSSITVTPPFVQNAIGATLYWKVSTDTNYNRVPFSGQLVLTSYTTGGVVPASIPSVDLSSNALAFPGAISQLLAPGSGAFIYDKHLNANASGTPYHINASPGVTNDLDNVYQGLWTNGKADPRWLMCNSYESIQISNSLSSTPFFIQPNGSPQESVGGYRVSRFVNKVTGNIVDVRVHPTLPQGVVLFLSDAMPPWYPGSDIPSVWSMEMSYDYLELDYPPTDPNFPIEVRNAGCLLAYFPVINGVGLNFGL